MVAGSRFRAAGKLVVITLTPRTNIDIEFDSGASYDSSAVWKVGARPPLHLAPAHAHHY
jgi:hypothetical protein